MKKILVLFLLFPFIIRSQSIISPPEMNPREVILAYRAAKNFVRDSSITIIIKPYSPLHPAINGVTCQVAPKMYIIDLNILLRNKTLRKWTILHELGHVIDLNNGTLSQFPSKWMGKKINNDLPWIIRPWEISADMWAEKMWIALIDKPQPYVIFEDPSQE